MLVEPGNQFSLTRAASSTSGRENPILISSVSRGCAKTHSYHLRITTLLVLAALSIAKSISAASWTDAGNYSTAWYTSNPSATIFTINSAAELAGLAVLVNSGNTFHGKTIKLSADINLAGKEWTAIGCWDTNQYTFGGVFDGGGKTLTRLTINNPSRDYAGLFGLVMDCIILDVNLVETSIVAGSMCGSVSGRVWSSTVRNCSNTGSVSSSGFDVGGLVGFSYNSEVVNCLNSGSVYCSGGVAGGIVGATRDSWKPAENCTNSGSVSSGAGHAGGVVGSGSAINCRNSGNVSAINNSYNDVIGAGGVAGELQGDLENCSNTGNVSITGSGRASNAGGVVGFIDSYSRARNCRNSGNISGTAMSYSCTGGVAGYVMDGSVVNCASSGSVNQSGSNSWIGGLVGIIDYQSTVQDCYWKKDGTAGFNRNAAGGGADRSTNCFSFVGPPGTISIGGVATPLLTVLNAWVNANIQAVPSLLVWTLDGSQTGYPILLYPPLASVNIGPITVTATQVTIVVNGVESGRTYQLQKSSTLTGGWLPVAAQTATGSSLTFTVPRLENQAFFQAKL